MRSRLDPPADAPATAGGGRIHILLSPAARSTIHGVPAQDWLAARVPGARVSAPSDPARLPGLAAAAAREADLLVLAGGDGWVHAVVNVLAPAFRAPALGLVPLGTGNDLARSAGIPLDPAAAVRLLRAGEDRPLDVVRVAGAAGGPARHFANAALAGYGADVEPSPAAKRLLGDRSYLLGALRRLPSLEARPVRLECGGETDEVHAYLVAVANGRCLGGGIPIASDARLDDGLLDVVAVRRAPLPRLVRAVTRLLRGEPDPAVLRRRGPVVRVSLPGEWRLNLDGERPELRPARFEAVPGALRLRSPARPVGKGGAGAPGRGRADGGPELLSRPPPSRHVR